MYDHKRWESVHVCLLLIMERETLIYDFGEGLNFFVFLMIILLLLDGWVKCSSDQCMRQVIAINYARLI